MKEYTQSDEPEIRLLPLTIQNKIAAGEVVERPASVVKELVENALDAGAGQISVDIEEGGLRLIRVSDDGQGMSEKNLGLCIERHATSKIRDVDDIFRIKTMGFRGEAIPSIGAVSRMSIATTLAGQKTGYILKLVGGAKEPIAPAPPRRGTCVEVRDLFFNTPARRKFMKSAAAEVAAINETVTRIALANPSVAFRVESNGKPQVELPPHPDLASRILALFGKNLRLLPVERTSGDNDELHITGFCARPPESRANSRFIYTFLNNRWIRHPGIARAISDAYQGSLPPRRYPFAVLMLQINPAMVDVNAHPTKEIVRFENEGLIVGAAHKAIREALRGASFLNEVERARQETTQSTNETQTQLRNTAAEAAGDYVRSHPDSEPRRTTPASFHNSTSTVERTNHPACALNRFSADAELARKILQESAPPFMRSASSEKILPALPFKTQKSTHKEETDISAFGAPSEYAVTSAPFPANASITPSGIRQTEKTATNEGKGKESNEQQAFLREVPLLRLVGQAGGRYLVVERPDGLLLVDQHAMHERWNYDRLREKNRPLVSQRMLLPVRIELTPAEKGLAPDAIEPLREAGFELELGEDAIEINAHPEIVPAERIEQTVRDVLADLEHEPLERFRETLLASLACHSAVLFGTRLSPEACLALLEKYKEGGLPTCPHGRPTGIFFSWNDLAARFGR